MMKHATVLTVVSAMFVAGTAIFPGTAIAVWQPAVSGFDGAAIRSFYTTPDDPDLLLAASTDTVFGRNGLDGFERRVYLSQSGQEIQDLAYDDERQLILIASTNGLYEAGESEESVRRIFTASDELARDCRRVVYRNGNIYLGTGRGAFVRKKGERQWSPVTPVTTAAVHDIGYFEDSIYIVTDAYVFRLNARTGTHSVIYSVGSTPDGGEEPGHSSRRSIAVTAEGALLLSLDREILLRDHDHMWRSLAGGRLPFNQIRTILPIDLPQAARRGAEPYFLVSSERGVYLYADGRWRSLSQGTGTVRTFDLAFSRNDGRIWLAGQDAVYQQLLSEFLDEMELNQGDVFPETGPSLAEVDFSHEPSIAEIHRWAIAYADVHPDKIRRWKRQARVKAWVPEVDIGVDGGQGWSRSDSLWGSSSSGGAHYVGPDDKSSDRDIGWDVSLSWDLSDVIWSTDQTGIDSRAKLMVELREDIINQVTRLYYERRRLQIEMHSPGPDRQPLWTYELRIAELTALLDGLTGGGFSRNVITKTNGINTRIGNGGGQDD